jgi:hypothetical protein
MQKRPSRVRCQAGRSGRERGGGGAGGCGGAFSKTGTGNECVGMKLTWVLKFRKVALPRNSDL